MCLYQNEEKTYLYDYMCLIVISHNTTETSLPQHATVNCSTGLSKHQNQHNNILCHFPKIYPYRNCVIAVMYYVVIKYVKSAKIAVTEKVTKFFLFHRYPTCALMLNLTLLFTWVDPLYILLWTLKDTVIKNYYLSI